MPTVSIIMPVYNKEKYVRKSINSILNQSYTDFELLIINDGSTDNSLSICKEFEEKDSRIKLISVPNGGVSKARNIGLDNASAEYVTFIDSDDTIDIDFIQNLYNCITINSVDLVISGLKKINSNRNNIEEKVPNYRGIKNIEEVIADFANNQKSTGLYGNCVSKIFRKELIDNIKFDENLRLAEDFDFYLKVYEVIKTIYFDDKTYYNYFQETENSSVHIDDYDIDYKSQLVIQIRYKKFLERKNAFFELNENIVSNNINNFIYCILIYSKKDNLKYTII